MDTIGTYTAVLDVRGGHSVLPGPAVVAAPPRAGHPPWAARSGCYRQAVLVIRWYLDGTRLAQLAADNRIGGSTAYRYLHEGIVWSS
jgi:hypothetical protein